MKFIILIILALSFNYANAKTVEEWDKIFIELSLKEKSSLVKTFSKSLKYNLSYSMTAIHLKESFGDRWSININSVDSIDVGSFMSNTKEYLRRNNREINKFTTARAIEELMDYETNFYHALSVLRECLESSKGNSKLAYQYYNGWKSYSKESKEYSQDVINIKKVLKKYFNNQEIVKGQK